MWPVSTRLIKTYRLPTPLLIFQLALIMGSFTTGFLLSPLLVLSRHIAQRPVKRLRFPQEKQRHRRALAAAFYAGTVLIVGGLVGMWTRWCLDSRDPWLWVLWWLLEGKKWWTRPALLLYWGTLCSISVAGWNRQLARSRRYRPKNTSNAGNGDAAGTVDVQENVAERTDHAHIRDNLPSTTCNGSGTLGLNFPNLPNGTNVSNVAADLLDAADKHVPTLSINARRKFFHGLAVVMFLPGVIVDVCVVFSSLLTAKEADYYGRLRSRICPSALPLPSSRLQNTSATSRCIRSVRRYICL
jgi:dolichol kinase